MKKYRASAVQLLRQIGSDYMLLAAFFVPLLLGALVRFGVPVLEGALTAYFSTAELLTPYYPLFDLLLCMIAPIMFCFSFAMVLLEEIDDKVARYFMVTPLGKGGYLVSRVGLPAGISLVFTPLLLLVFHISPLAPGTILALSLLGCLMGIIVSLVIIALSANKLEGMAATKLASMLMLGASVPYFIQTDAGKLFMLLPSYWLGQYALAPSLLTLCGGLGVCGIWIVMLAGRFRRKVSS